MTARRSLCAGDPAPDPCVLLPDVGRTRISAVRAGSALVLVFLRHLR